MKIALLSGSNSRNSGGLYTSVRRLAQTLKNENIKADILAHHDNFSRLDLPAYGDVKPISYTLKGPANFGYSTDLYSILRQGKPDIIHTQCIWMYLSKMSLKLYKKYRVPHIVSPRGMLDPWAVQHAAWKKKIVARWFENEHLRTASCIHALCQPEADAIRQYGLSNPVTVIPNGVDLPDENTSHENTVPDWRENVPAHKKVLLFLGRIHSKKGLLPLLEAWAANQKKMKDWCLVIAGWDQGGYQKQLEEKVKQWGLEKQVIFVGTQLGKSKVATYLHADAFILPSFSEGLPMAVLEAWSYKLPVLMTPFCNLQAGFQQKAAISIKPEKESIAHGLQQLISLSETQRNALGNNGYALVKEKFTWDKVAQQMSEVYNWVLQKHPQPACVLMN